MFLLAPRELPSIRQRQGVRVTSPTCFSRFRSVGPHGHGGGSFFLPLRSRRSGLREDARSTPGGAAVDDRAFTEEKRALRRELLERRSHLAPSERASASERAALFLAESPIFSSARTVALYSPIRCEIDPSTLEALAARHDMRIAYPRVDGSSLVFCLSQESDLELGAFGILEPRHGSLPVELDTIDLFVVPGVAFSLRGERIGYGRGYYDRVIREARGRRSPSPVAVGFAFACQVVESLPRSPNDEIVDALVTENGLFLIDAHAHSRSSDGPSV